MRRVDVVALVFGVLLTAAAAAFLWLALVGPIDERIIQIGTPILLVGVGVSGLALSRNRT